MAGVQEVLAERYELLEVVGRGGMGVVYRARDRVLDRVVAVKVLPLDRAQDPLLVARFEREALAAAGLSHTNIVSVFDSGTDAETRFIVMEFLSGQSFAELLCERGALDAREAVEAATQVAAALAAAHRAGIVHRDIKPANVMLDQSGHVKVLDFGIARLTTGISLTQTATVLGSASYLAPELCRGAPADARSDIYALGCVLYELLTGQPPFTGDLPAAVISQQISEPPRDPAQLNPAIPSALSGLVLAMLAKDPRQRPQEARELLIALPDTLAEPAATVATVRGAPTVDEAATTRNLAPVAPTIPLGLAAADATRVMPGTMLPSSRKFALVAGLLAMLLALIVLALAAPAGHPPANRQAARKRAATTSTASSLTSATGPNQRTVTGPSQRTVTGPSQPSATQKTKPAATTPPGQRQHGHHGGPSPGQAKKQGDQGNDQADQ